MMTRVREDREDGREGTEMTRTKRRETVTWR